MNIVSFPGLNLNFKFSKIAFCIFGIEVYKYAVCIVLGMIIALVLCRIAKEKFGINFEFVLENMIIGIFFGIIGARIYYVIFNLNYYLKNIREIFNVRNGGLAIYGGLIFAGLAIFINCKIKKKDVLNFFDYIIPYVALAQCFGRFGNFFNIEAYGTKTDNFFRMAIQELDSKIIEVHPVFLYEAIATLGIFIILKFLQYKRKFKGEIFVTYLMMYAGVRSILEQFRVDSLMLFNWRISQILSILIFLISFTILICRKMSNEKSLKY